MRLCCLTLLLSVLLSGCIIFLPGIRYELESTDEVILSNFPTRFLTPNNTGDSFEIQYSVLIKNILEKEALSFPLNEIQIALNKEINKPKCKTFEKQEGTVSVVPGNQVRIDCTINIKPNSENDLKKSDVLGMLAIPYQRGSVKKQITGKFQLTKAMFK